jgi:hypothetical protein
LKIRFIPSAWLIAVDVAAREYHVSVNASDANKGTASSSFPTINDAAQLALAGDEDVAHLKKITGNTSFLGVVESKRKKHYPIECRKKFRMKYFSSATFLPKTVIPFSARSIFRPKCSLKITVMVEVVKEFNRS